MNPYLWYIFNCDYFINHIAHSFQHDLGFSGSNVGQNTVVVGGSNWNNATLPAYVNNAFSTAQGAHSGL